MKKTFTFEIDVAEGDEMEKTKTMIEAIHNFPMERVHYLADLITHDEETRPNKDKPFDVIQAVLKHLEDNDFTGNDILFYLVTGYKAMPDAQRYANEMMKGFLAHMLPRIMGGNDKGNPKIGSGAEDLLKSLKDMDTPSVEEK